MSRGLQGLVLFVGGWCPETMDDKGIETLYMCRRIHEGNRDMNLWWTISPKGNGQGVFYLHSRCVYERWRNGTK